MEIGWQIRWYRLAQKHAAGSAAERHTGGIRRGTIAFVDGRSVLGGQVGCVHDVLGGEWHAVNRTAARAPVAFARLRQGKIVVPMNPRFDLRFPCMDPLEAGTHQSFGREFAFANEGRGFTRR